MSCVLEVTNIRITGDCSSTQSGAFFVNISTQNTTTLTWISPSLGTTYLGNANQYILTNLSAGTYSFTITDACSPPNNRTVEIYVSSGTCAYFTGETNTTCGLSNGSLTAQTTNFYGTGKFLLFNQTGQYITSATTDNNTYVFENLSADTYYAVVDDGGGCTGRTESCIIKSSTTMDFGFYVINNSSCSNTVDSAIGKIMVTGITGNPPYTYSWNTTPIQTSSTATGLTQGTYTLTVTDSSGCVTSKTAVVGTVPPVGLSYFEVITSPSCFAYDGELKIYITGGTPPYYYNNVSVGQSAISYSTNHTFTGLSSQLMTITVTDAAFCTFTTEYNFISPNSFSVAEIITTDATCQGNVGSVNVSLLGGGPFIYVLSGQSGTDTVLSLSQNHIFNSLSAGNYFLTISADTCVYTQNIKIENDSLFNLSVNTTGTTCNQENGSFGVVISGGTAPYTIETDVDIVTTSLTSTTFTNLAYGSYNVTVYDSSIPPCYQTTVVNVPASSYVYAQLVPTSILFGNDGQIQALISNGAAPFTWTWSNNVNGQTGLTLNNLSAGTYSFIVEDSSGCTFTATTTIVGFQKLTNYQTYSICDSNFETSGSGIKGIKEMTAEGFLMVSSAETGCTITSTTFTAIVEIGGQMSSTTFYSGTSLTDIPTNDDWISAIEYLFDGFSGVSTTNINETTNTIVVNTNCSRDINPYAFDNTQVKLTIHYGLSCDDIP
jgi:hypothetical protein